MGRRVCMSKIIEDMRNEAVKDVAIRMIKKGKMSLEEIADYTKLSVDEVKELGKILMQMA